MDAGLGWMGGGVCRRDDLYRDDVLIPALDLVSLVLERACWILVSLSLAGLLLTCLIEQPCTVIHPPRRPTADVAALGGQSETCLYSDCCFACEALENVHGTMLLRK